MYVFSFIGHNVVKPVTNRTSGMQRDPDKARGADWRAMSARAHVCPAPRMAGPRPGLLSSAIGPVRTIQFQRFAGQRETVSYAAETRRRRSGVFPNNFERFEDSEDFVRR